MTLIDPSGMLAGSTNDWFLSDLWVTLTILVGYWLEVPVNDSVYLWLNGHKLLWSTELHRPINFIFLTLPFGNRYDTRNNTRMKMHQDNFNNVKNETCTVIVTLSLPRTWRPWPWYTGHTTDVQPKLISHNDTKPHPITKGKDKADCLNYRPSC